MPFDDAPTTVIDLRGRSTFAVDSGASHVARTLAAGGDVVAIDAGDSAAVAIAAARAGTDRAVVLVDRLDGAAAQLGAAQMIAGSAPDAVVVNVGVPVGDPGVAVVDAGAASLLAAQAARARLLAAAL